MRKILLIIILSALYTGTAFSQSERVIGPVEQRLVDSLCNDINKLDISKINTQEEAVAAYTQCVENHADILNDLATELKVDIADLGAMKKVGINLAFDLYKMKCEKFMKLSTIMAMKTINKDISKTDVSTGVLKRIDQKGFNYIVITDQDNNEKSFIWLRQFPGSEKFMDGITQYVGKKIMITWAAIEIYLPQSKGYYTVKEIKSLDFL